MPLLLVIVPGIYIAVNSTTMLYESNPILYNLTFCLIGSKITNKLIVSSNNQLTRHLLTSLFYYDYR